MSVLKRRLTIALGVVVSGAFLWLFVHDIDWPELGRSLRKAKLGYVFLAAFLHFTVYGLRAWRWRILCAPLKVIGIAKMFTVTMIGFMTNCVLPARAGEIIGPWLLSKRENLRFSSVLATIVVDRVADLIGMMLIFAGLIPFLPEGLDQFRKGAAILSVVILAGTVCLFTLAVYPKQWGRFLHRVFSILPAVISRHLIAITDSFISGFQVVRDVKSVVKAVVNSVVIWLIVGSAVYTLFFAFELEVGIVEAFLVLFCVAFAIAVPQAPGFIGVWHFATKWVLKKLGADTDPAAAYAIVLWAAFVLPTIVVGFFCLWKEGISLGELSRHTESEEAAPEAAG